MMLPNRVTSLYLQVHIALLEEYLSVPLTMDRNSWGRTAIRTEDQDLLTPGYLGNRELACWISGAFLEYDKGDTLDVIR